MSNYPVNVYGVTQHYEDGLLEEVYDGFGFRDKNGNVTWYEGYKPKDDDSHSTIIVPYGNGIDLKEIK